MVALPEEDKVCSTSIARAGSSSVVPLTATIRSPDLQPELIEGAGAGRPPRKDAITVELALLEHRLHPHQTREQRRILAQRRHRRRRADILARRGGAAQGRARQQQGLERPVTLEQHPIAVHRVQTRAARDRRVDRIELGRRGILADDRLALARGSLSAITPARISGIWSAGRRRCRWPRPRRRTGAR